MSRLRCFGFRSQSPITVIFGGSHRCLTAALPGPDLLCDDLQGLFYQRRSSHSVQKYALLIWLKASGLWLQMHLHSAGGFTKELGVRPHQSMALHMCRLFSATMSANAVVGIHLRSPTFPAPYCRWGNEYHSAMCRPSA